MSVITPFITRIKTNLDEVLQITQMINGVMMTGDDRANQIIVELYNSSGRVRLDPEPFDTGDSKVVGYFIRGDGYTVEVDGSINENGEPTVIIPAAAYISTGALSIAIRILDGKHIIIDPLTEEETVEWDRKTVVAALSCFVQNTETDAIIDPDHKIPDVQELLAYIDFLSEQYSLIEEAEGLRVIAETNRASAEEARESAETTRQSTFETNETQRASTFSTNEATRQATFTSSENQRATAFTTSEAQRASVFTAKEAARETRVNTVTSKIDNMTVAAQAVPYNGTPSAVISEVDGHKHIQFGLVSGHPFSIKKTFPTIEAMEEYTGTDVEVGDLVIIASTVEDPDNAKLYVKTATDWAFIIDMSGAKGIQGPPGPIGPRGYSITSVTFNADGTANFIFEDGTTYVTPPIKGEKGDPGAGSFVVSYDSSNDSIDVQITDV